MVDKYIQGLIDREPPDSPVKYQFLDRMRFDCNYLTGDSGPKYRIGDFLWADNVEDQIVANEINKERSRNEIGRGER